MSRTSNLTGKSPKEVIEVLNKQPTINKAADVLNVAPGTLFRYIRNKKLKRVTRVEWELQS